MLAKRWLHQLLTLAVLPCVANPASGGDIKAYSGSFCSSEDAGVDISHFLHKLRANEYMEITCPILRDQTESVGLPRIYLEVYHWSASDSALACSLYWIDEDSAAGQLRGWSDSMSASTTGQAQFAWDALNEFDGMSSPPALMSAGGEGTMQIGCTLEDRDLIYQYQVEENVFN